MKKNLFALFAMLAASAAIAQTPVVTTNGTDNALQSGYENCVRALGGYPHADCNVQPPREMPVVTPTPQPQYETQLVHQKKHFNTDTLFAFDSATLSQDGHVVLKDVAGDLLSSNAKNTRFKVVGYTDSMGSEAYNQKLSEQRAHTVAQALTQYGVPNVSHHGAGESNLLTAHCDTRYPKTKKGTKAHQDKIACHKDSRRVEVEGYWEMEKVKKFRVQ